MQLHHNEAVFAEFVEAASNYNKIPEEFVQKDYYVSLLLKEMVGLNPNIVFKGGTSLSKCYKVIDRFSEDIDINIQSSTKLNNRKRKELKESVENAIYNLNLDLVNASDIKTRRDFNQYKVFFPTLFGSTGNLKEHLLIETYVSLASYPTERGRVTNYISDYLEAEHPSFIEKFDLARFEIKVQFLERTLIDKIFAICDYYEKGQISQNSRHIYDTHKIWANAEFDKERFLKLLEKVAIDRSMKVKVNISSEKGYPLLNTLKEIISNEIYKEDYESITASLLFSECTYNESIMSLQDIVERGFLPTAIGQSN